MTDPEPNNTPDHKIDQEQAKVIYETGKFIDTCIKQFKKVWYKDEFILKFILLQTANAYVINADTGIHLHISGQTQCGKSASVKTALRFIPPKNKQSRTFSKMWLFYAGDKIKPKTVLFSDDTIIDPQLGEIFRNILTSWHTGVTRGTVIKNAAQDLKIPLRISLILTSIENVTNKSDDAQDESRFLTVEIKRTQDDILAIQEFSQLPQPDISHELTIINLIWDIIQPAEITLHKKVSKPEMTIREFKEFLSLIRANALLHNRTITIDQDIEEIEQLLTYSRPMKKANIAGLTPNEKAVLQAIEENEHKWTDVSIIQEKTKLPTASVYVALRGKSGSFTNPTGGLMTKEGNLQHMYEPSTRQYSFIITKK